MRSRKSLPLALLVAAVIMTSQALQASESLGRVVVFTSALCGFCRDFQREVGNVYPRTQLSRQLPMIIVDKNNPPGDMVQLVKQIHFTPTLIVLDRQGKEQARILGYRGEESFWASMEEMAKRLERASVSH